MVRWIDEWPGATVHLPQVSGLWTAAATAVVVYWLGWGWVRDVRAWGGTVIVAVWLAVICTVGVRVPSGVLVRIDTLACGDGECHLVRSGREAMLVNAGASGTRPRADDLARAIRAVGAWRVPTVLITDPRVQAWSEVDGLVEPLGIRTVLVPASLENAASLDPTGAAAELVRRLRARSVNVRVVSPGDSFGLGSRGGGEHGGRTRPGGARAGGAGSGREPRRAAFGGVRRGRDGTRSLRPCRPASDTRMCWSCPARCGARIGRRRRRGRSERRVVVHSGAVSHARRAAGSAARS